MSEQTSQNASDEIDLGVVFEKIKSFFKSILIGIIQIFQFFWKHKVRLIILLIISISLQYVLYTQSEKVYTNEYLLRTNFDSTEYLYNKVNSLNTKLESEDTVYLKQVFGIHYNKVNELEVVPVIDVYNLVDKSENNKEIFELLLDEYGDISFLEEKINLDQYANHRLRVHVKGKDNNESIAKNLYNFLSDNVFYTSLKDTAIENYKDRINQNRTIIVQIDSIIKDKKGFGVLTKSDNNGINFSGSLDFGGLLRQKQESLYDELLLKNMLASNSEVFKIIDSSIGVYNYERTTYFFTIPILIIGTYCSFFLMSFISKRVKRFVSE